MGEIIERGAEAMRAKRRELIAQPLDRIWPELMRAAIEAMREPTEGMMVEAEIKVPELFCFDDKDKSPSYVAWQAMISAALTDREG